MRLKDDLPPKIRLSFIRNVRLQKMQNALKDSIIFLGMVTAMIRLVDDMWLRLMSVETSKEDGGYSSYGEPNMFIG